MRILKKLLVCTLLMGLCITAAACGNSDSDAGATDPLKDAKEYTNKTELYSIKVAGEWTETPASNEEQIVLDDADQTLTVMTQRFPKEEAKKNTGTDSLDKFIELYHSTALTGLRSMSGEPTTEDFAIEGMTTGKAEEYTATQGSNTALAYLVYAESDTAYYACTITGVKDLYDKNIDTLKQSLTTLTEK